MAEQPASTKPVHTIVLDAGPILKNVPPLSTLLAQAEELVTTPAVVGEIRDPVARSRVETLYLPFMKQRTPSPKSVQVISEFARKTGDRAVLSKVDIEILALAYEIECERNGGDWRLRSVPGQKRVNGKPPIKEGEASAENATTEKVDEAAEGAQKEGEVKNENTTADVDKVTEDLAETTIKEDAARSTEATEIAPEETAPATDGRAEDSIDDITVEVVEDEEEGEDSDGGGEWITPSNIKKKQARDEEAGLSGTPEPKVMQVATMTTDFAVSYISSEVESLWANCSPVSKCSSSNELEPAINNDTATNSSPQDIRQALPRMLLHHKRNEQAVLSSMWKRHPHTSLMLDRRQRSIQTPPQKKHAVE